MVPVSMPHSQHGDWHHLRGGTSAYPLWRSPGTTIRPQSMRRRMLIRILNIGSSLFVSTARRGGVRVVGRRIGVRFTSILSYGQKIRLPTHGIHEKRMRSEEAGALSRKSCEVSGGLYACLVAFHGGRKAGRSPA